MASPVPRTVTTPSPAPASSPRSPPTASTTSPSCGPTPRPPPCPARRDPELVARRYATVVDLTGADDAATTRLEAALGQARAVPAPDELRERLDAVLAGDVTGSVTGLAPLLTTTAGFLRALAAGSNPVWIEDDTDELADRVTRRDSALLATADELTDSARRAAAGLLD